MNQTENQFIQKLTIKSCLPLYSIKTNELATKMKLVLFEENNFQVASGHNVNPGEQHYFVFPDVCVSTNDFITQQIDPKKLGKINGEYCRVRAIKFNWGIDESNPRSLYSNGILLKNQDIQEYLMTIGKEDAIESLDLISEAIGLYKPIDEPDNPKVNKQLQGKRDFPTGIFKTDETNIKHDSVTFEYPTRVIGTLKVDGSSITFGTIKGDIFIASRNVDKSKHIWVERPTGVRKPTIIEQLKMWSRNNFPFLKRFISRVDLNTYETVFNSDDDFIKYGYPLAEKIKNQAENSILFKEVVPVVLGGKYYDVLFRGELSGNSMKGSGNKKNPHSKLENKIRVFTGEHYNGIETTRMNYDELVNACKDFDFEMTPTIFDEEVTSQEHLMSLCDQYFKSNLVEGIVVRNFESTISRKVMNDAYDAEK